MTRQEAEAKVNAELARMRAPALTSTPPEMIVPPDVDDQVAGEYFDDDLTVQLVTDPKRGLILVRMDPPVSVLRFTPEQARRFADNMRTEANRVAALGRARRR